MAWVFALLTAAWFGWMAYRAQRGWLFWAIGGAFLGLVTTTIVLGLVRAACVPLDSHHASLLRLRAYGASVLIILAFGWLATMGLHQHAHSLWKHLTRDKHP